MSGLERSWVPLRFSNMILKIFAFLLILNGAVWFLQGINLLPGSFMTGQIEWAVYGSLAFIIGLGLVMLANRRKKEPPKGNQE